MLVEGLVLLAASAFLLVGKLKAEVMGRPWQFKCLRSNHYLLRYLQTLLVIFKPAPKLEVMSSHHYPEASTTIDWVRTRNTSHPPNSRLLLVVPGLTGTSHDNYVASTVAELQQFYSEVGVYQYALVSDAKKQGRVDIIANFKHVIESLAASFAVIDCVGFSYGANQLLYYLGQEGPNCKIHRAVVVSNPFSIKKCSDLIRPLESKALTRIIKQSVGRIRHNFDSYNIDWERLAQCERLTDFDREFTIKVYGFPTVDDYYVQLSSARFVDGVAVPTLSISSRDDSISNFKAISFSDRITYLITDLGGHNAFLDWRFRFWFLSPLKEFITSEN